MAIRYLANNLITSETMITPSTERPGQVGLAVKVGSGSAIGLASGLYTGISPCQYIVEIDSVAAGTGIGQATFRWRHSTDTTWLYSGVTTALTATVLESGVAIAWSSGGGTEFVVGDYWTITVDKAFGRLRLIDRDRDTEWRTDGIATRPSIEIDLGTAQAVDVVAVCDHNLTSLATLSIAGNSSASWDDPPLSEAITWKDDNIVHYLTTVTRTYRYWRLSMIDDANSDTYFRISSLYLGTYTSFSRAFAYEWNRARNASIYGPSGALRKPRGVWAQAEVIEVLYGFMTSADQAAALALFDHIYDPTTGVVRPIMVNFDSSDTSDISLYELEDPELIIVTPQKTDLYGWRFRLRQRTRIARSAT